MIHTYIHTSSYTPWLLPESGTEFIVPRQLTTVWQEGLGLVVLIPSGCVAKINILWPVTVTVTHDAALLCTDVSACELLPSWRLFSGSQMTTMTMHWLRHCMSLLMAKWCRPEKPEGQTLRNLQPSNAGKDLLALMSYHSMRSLRGSEVLQVSSALPLPNNKQSATHSEEKWHIRRSEGVALDLFTEDPIINLV
jgi:hypothetical protein